MKYIQNETTNTLEVKQSKFIAFLVPFSAYKQKLKLLKESHPKARHFVVASRYINKFDQIVEHCSDDGEPKGTSGKPTLAVLAGNGLINTGVIIVRYFGGTKLGTGGLVRAYSDACNEVIQQSDLLEYVKLYEHKFCVKYKDISIIDYKLEEERILVEDKSFDENGATFIVKSEEQSWNKFFKENERIIILE